MAAKTQAQLDALKRGREGRTNDDSDIFDVTVTRPTVPPTRRKKIVAAAVGTAAAAAGLVALAYAGRSGPGGDDWTGDDKAADPGDDDGQGDDDDQQDDVPTDDEQELPEPDATLWPEPNPCEGHAVYDIAEGYYAGAHWEGCFYMLTTGQSVNNVIAEAYATTPNAAPAGSWEAALELIAQHPYNADRFGDQLWLVNDPSQAAPMKYGSWKQQYFGEFPGDGNRGPVLFLPWEAERCTPGDVPTVPGGGDGQGQEEEGEPEGQEGQEDADKPCPDDPTPTAAETASALGAIGDAVDNLTMPSWWDTAEFGQFDPSDPDAYGFAGWLWFLGQKGFYAYGGGGPTGPWATANPCTLNDAQSNLWTTISDYHVQTHGSEKNAALPAGRPRPIAT